MAYPQAALLGVFSRKSGMDGTSAQPSWTENNGFDFGASQSGFGLNYGLLGDVHALLQNQECGGCQQGEPCQQCASTDANKRGNNDGQVIEAQFPIPLPGLVPPPPAAPSQTPSGPLTAGNPNAWWNKGDSDLLDWFKSLAKGQPSEEVEQECEENWNKEEIYCKIVKATRTLDEARACRETAANRYAECRKYGGVKGIRTPPFYRT